MISLYKAHYQYVKNSMVITETCYLASHSKEQCIDYICDTLGVRELKYSDITAISHIHGFCETICKEITSQNYKKFHDSLEIAKGLDGSNFPTQQSVEDYRRQQDSIKYRYNMNNRQAPLGMPNVNNNPKNDLLEKYSV